MKQKFNNPEKKDVNELSEEELKKVTGGDIAHNTCRGCYSGFMYA